MRFINLRECLGLDPIDRKYYASGDSLVIWTPQANEPPASAFATFDTRNAHPILDFDDTTEENGIFSAVLPRNYAGGGLSVNVHWAATSATTGTVVWQSAFEAIGTALDIDADSFATGNNGTLVAPATTGNLGTTNIAHTDGAQIDSLEVGQAFRVRISREVADAQDSMTGDAEARMVEIRET